MRQAELVLALIMGLVSASLMWKSAELPVGWIPDRGPGGGAFPFWLSAGMLVCCIWILIRWVRNPTGVAADDRPYFAPETRNQVIVVTIALAVMIGLVHIIGVYGAVPLFLVFYLRVLGRHGWGLTAAFGGGDAGRDVLLLRGGAQDHLAQGIYRAPLLPALRLVHVSGRSGATAGDIEAARRAVRPRGTGRSRESATRSVAPGPIPASFMRTLAQR